MLRTNANFAQTQTQSDRRIRGRLERVRPQGLVGCIVPLTDRTVRSRGRPLGPHLVPLWLEALGTKGSVRILFVIQKSTKPGLQDRCLEPTGWHLLSYRLRRPRPPPLGCITQGGWHGDIPHVPEARVVNHQTGTYRMAFYFGPVLVP